MNAAEIVICEVQSDGGFQMRQLLAERIGLTKLSRKSDTTAAVNYALGVGKALVRYCDDGRISGVEASVIVKAPFAPCGKALKRIPIGS
jgi:hypothetical protein